MESAQRVRADRGAGGGELLEQVVRAEAGQAVSHAAAWWSGEQRLVASTCDAAGHGAGAARLEVDPLVAVASAHPDRHVRWVAAHVGDVERKCFAELEPVEHDQRDERVQSRIERLGGGQVGVDVVGGQDDRRARGGGRRPWAASGRCRVGVEDPVVECVTVERRQRRPPPPLCRHAVPGGLLGGVESDDRRHVGAQRHRLLGDAPLPESGQVDGVRGACVGRSKRRQPVLHQLLERLLGSGTIGASHPPDCHPDPAAKST